MWLAVPSRRTAPWIFLEENFNSFFATAHNNHQQQQVERD
jgi:hypothetical protein